MSVGAGRKVLRHRLYPYEEQQTSNLYNAGHRDKVSCSAERLFIKLKPWWNKERARLVPAAAVTPALQVIRSIIEFKSSVAGSISSNLNLLT